MMAKKQPKKPKKKSEKQVSTIAELAAKQISIIGDLAKETDRGAVLVAAAYLDDAIEVLLRARLLPEKKVLDQLLGDRVPTRAKDNLAYALGLVGQEVRQDLKLIREIRNEFAHSHRHVSFSQAEIKNKCYKLKTARHEREMIQKHMPQPPRFYFLLNAVRLSQRILTLAGSTEQVKAGKP